MSSVLTRFITLFCLFFLANSLFAQEKFTLSGYVKDAASGEDLIGASVVVKELSTGAYANEYGFYSLTLPEGEYEFEFRYLSYNSVIRTIKLNKNITLNVELSGADVQVEEVVITGERNDANVTSTEMSTVTVDVEMIKKMPALFGEVDIIKTIQLMPGVQAVGEGLSGYYVRGGGSDQNLILLDEATVFNASHVLGFFSVFNADALKSEIKLYKGGIPARYGSRLASVLDLRMKEGNLKSWHGAGGIGLLSSRLTFEGPFHKEKGSFMLSGRRTYADLFLLISKDPDIRKSQAYFYDINAKANYKFSDKDRLFLSGYFGRDVFGLSGAFGNQWGNSTATARWNHLWNDKLFSNTTFIFSDFNYGFDFELSTFDKFKYDAGIMDFSLKTDFNYYLNPKNQLQFGANIVLHRFNPGQFIPEGDALLNPLKLDPDYAIESAVYLSNEHKISDLLTLEYGLRYSMFDQIGPGKEFNYESDGETVADTTDYSRGQLISHFWQGFEPRFSARIIVDEFSSIKASYNRTLQYLHLASNSVASFPWDIWIPSSKHIAPQISDQIAVGYFRNFFDNQLETSVEVYAKYMQNQIDFKDGADLVLNDNLETELLKGIGWSYGAEFFVRKRFGKFTGWVGYTLSWTRRKIDGINNNNPYPAKNDRRHDVSIVAMYDVHKMVTISATWVYGTGNATTFPGGKYPLQGFTVGFYPSRNFNNLPAFHRLDLACDLKLNRNENARLQNSINISCYNAYGRKNPFAIQFRADEDNPGKLRAYKTYLFRWVPSITWNFKF